MTVKTMAEVLAEHQPTSKLLSPSDVRTACLCGRFVQDDELPTYHNAWIIAHQSAAMPAAGYGLVADAKREAWAEGKDAVWTFMSNQDPRRERPTNPYREGEQ